MSTKRNATASPAERNPLAAWNDLPRQQLAVATEGACAVFRGFEAIRKIQEKAAHQALVHHAAAVEKLKQATDPMQLMMIQSELIRFDLERATQYWQQLGAAAMEMHSQIMGSANHLVDSDGVLSAASALDHLPAMANLFAQFMPNGAAQSAQR